MKSLRRGLFLTFEGGEAVGKTTQIALLSKALKAKGYKVLVTREPGGTKLGEHLRRLVKSQPMSERAELMIFEASRAEHVATVIQPHLKKKFIVLCDRYSESSLVYQGMTRGLPIADVKDANRIATGGLQSDFVVLLSGSEAKERLKNRRIKDRIEREKGAFHLKIAANYLKLAKADKRFHIYSADLNRQLIHKMILKDVFHLIQVKVKNA